MTVNVTLHAHERVGSPDSMASAKDMLRRYRDAGIDLVGFVGHGTRAATAAVPGVETVVGVEHELQSSPGRLHVVEFPEHDFSFLAHPAITQPHETRETAVSLSSKLGVDAVEKYNAGKKQYNGSIDLPELANDDAHNGNQLASSYMRVEADSPDPEAVFNAIRSGDYTLVNSRIRTDKFIAGKVGQAASFALSP